MPASHDRTTLWHLAEAFLKQKTLPVRAVCWVGESFETSIATPIYVKAFSVIHFLILAPGSRWVIAKKWGLISHRASDLGQLEKSAMMKNNFSPIQRPLRIIHVLFRSVRSRKKKVFDYFFQGTIQKYTRIILIQTLMSGSFMAPF